MTENAHHTPTEHLPPKILALTSLAEEASEVAIEVSKALRFTPHGVSSYGSSKGTTPLERLAGEIGDFLGCLDFLFEEFPELDVALVEERRKRKPARIIHFNNPENW